LLFLQLASHPAVSKALGSREFEVKVRGQWSVMLNMS